MTGIADHRTMAHRDADLSAPALDIRPAIC